METHYRLRAANTQLKKQRKKEETIMKQLYTINFDKDYVFTKREDAENTKLDLQSRFEDKFEIYTIAEDDEEFDEYKNYV